MIESLGIEFWGYKTWYSYILVNKKKINSCIPDYFFGSFTSTWVKIGSQTQNRTDNSKYKYEKTNKNVIPGLPIKP